jgi:hypothetical protein
MSAFDSLSCNPFDLILIVKNAAITFDTFHSSNEDLYYKDATNAAKKMMKWLYTVHKNFIKEMRLNVDPDNKELQIYANICHQKCIFPSLKQGTIFATTGQGANNSMISQLVTATNRNNKVCKETNKLWQAEYDWKHNQDDIKKDRTKDPHPSIRTMIKNASAIKHDKLGEICTNFLVLYHWKSCSRLDNQPHQCFEDIGFGDVVFTEGVSTNLLAGVITRVHMSAPGPFSPFSFSKMQALGGNNNKDRSLLLEIFSAVKGRLMRNLEDVKTSAKMTVTIPQDFHSFLYQIKAFANMTSFIFGTESILTGQLWILVNKNESNAITYKIMCIAQDKTFPTKILWAVSCRVNFFHEDCRKCIYREDVNSRVINFHALHMDVMLNRFNAQLPAIFHMMGDTKEKEPEGGKKKKRKSKEKVE